MAGIGSGLGAFFSVAEGSNNGTQNYAVGSQWGAQAFRTIPVKSAKGTWDPHIITGGPYVRGPQSGNVVDIGSANIPLYTDAKMDIVGDFMNTGMMLLLAQAFGIGYAGVQGIQAGVQQLNAPLTVQDGLWIDGQIMVPDTGGSQYFQNYHSGKITKAEFVIPRDGLATYNYSVDWGYVEFASGSQGVSQPVAPVPFSMQGAGSQFLVWNVDDSAYVTLDGCKKMTISIAPKMATTRIYLGKVYKDEPISNGLIEVTVAAEFDFSPVAYANAFANFIPHTQLGAQGHPTILKATSTDVIVTGISSSLQFAFPQLFIQSGGEYPLEGVDIVKNTINLKATLDPYGDAAVTATLVTGDNGF